MLPRRLTYVDRLVRRLWEVLTGDLTVGTLGNLDKVHRWLGVEQG